jgi:hypothetical protein
MDEREQPKVLKFRWRQERGARQFTPTCVAPLEISLCHFQLWSDGCVDSGKATHHGKRKISQEDHWQSWKTFCESPCRSVCFLQKEYCEELRHQPIDSERSPYARTGIPKICSKIAPFAFGGSKTDRVPIRVMHWKPERVFEIIDIRKSLPPIQVIVYDRSSTMRWDRSAGR